MLNLPLISAYAAPQCPAEALPEVEQVLTPEWLAHYDATAWRDYDARNHRRVELPELGPKRRPRSWDGGVVVPIMGRRYRVELVVDPRGWDEPFEPGGKRLVLEETDAPETTYTPGPAWPSPGDRPGTLYWPDGRNSYFFGQPRFIQNEIFPADRHGRPCYNLLTDENGWGDSGNWNILLGLDPDGRPEVAYFEASCC